MRTAHIALAIAALTIAQSVPQSAYAVDVELSMEPENPTPDTPVTLKIEVNNDTLYACDYEVRLFDAYGGLTEYEREDDGDTIRLRGELIPHLIAPVEVIPCDVPCIDALVEPRATYGEVELGELDLGEHTVELLLPALCDLRTDCLPDGVVECDFEEPVTFEFLVSPVADVHPYGKLPVTWTALKARGRG